MPDKGAKELTGLTAKEIQEAKFKNELGEGDLTETIFLASEFLNEREFDVWEFRETASEGTVWRDALDKFWLVNHETGDIVRATKWKE